MEHIYCQNCGKQTGYKRALGWGTFFAVILTGGLWLFAIPFYPKRCILCGNENPFGPFHRPRSGPTPPITLKKCPKCAEEVRAEAQICRFCHYEFPQPNVYKESQAIYKEPVPWEMKFRKKKK